MILHGRGASITFPLVSWGEKTLLLSVRDEVALNNLCEIIADG